MGKYNFILSKSKHWCGGGGGGGGGECVKNHNKNQKTIDGLNIWKKILIRNTIDNYYYL